VIIDHDLAKATSIRVPVRASEGVSKFTAETIPLPLESSTNRSLLKPWHFHSIDPVELDAFAGKIQRSLDTLGIEQPIAVPFCNYLREHSEGLNAATALSQARHRIEVQAGVCNLEIPMSRICETRSWVDFVVHCIEQADALHDLYNACLADYRREYNVHNAGQPVPSLHREADWVELRSPVTLPSGPFSKRRNPFSRYAELLGIHPKKPCPLETTISLVPKSSYPSQQ
jgi:hypothetical protein